MNQDKLATFTPHSSIFVKFVTCLGLLSSLVLCGCGSPSVAVTPKRGLIHASVREGDMGKLMATLSGGVSENDINGFNESRRSPLTMAVEKREIEFVKILIEHGADIDMVDGSGANPLRIAILTNKTAVAKYLIDKGADVNAIFPDGRTILHDAAIQGMFEMVHILLDKGADINAVDKQGNNLLFITIPSKNIQELKRIVHRGADVKAINKGGLNLAHRCAMAGIDVLIAEFVGNGVDVNYAAKDSFLPIHWAIANGHLDAVNELIKCGSKTNVLTRSGLTFAHLAAASGQLKILRWLVEEGYSINEENISGLTPLYLAVENNHDDVIEYLIQMMPEVTPTEEYPEMTAKVFQMIAIHSIEKDVNNAIDCLYTASGYYNTASSQLVAAANDYEQRYREAKEDYYIKQLVMHSIGFATAYALSKADSYANYYYHPIPNTMSFNYMQTQALEYSCVSGSGYMGYRMANYIAQNGIKYKLKSGDFQNKAEKLHRCGMKCQQLAKSLKSPNVSIGKILFELNELK